MVSDIQIIFCIDILRKFHYSLNEKKNEKDLDESQILAHFDSSPLIQNSKFNNFLWVC